MLCLVDNVIGYYSITYHIFDIESYVTYHIRTSYHISSPIEHRIKITDEITYLNSFVHPLYMGNNNPKLKYKTNIQWIINYFLFT